MDIPVFVYGTLRTGQNNHQLIAPYVESISEASITGELYQLPYGYPAVINGCGLVRGELIKFNDLKAALCVMDILEGYRGPGQNNHYDRIEVSAQLPSGDALACLVYVYPEERRSWLNATSSPIEGGDWIEYRS